MNNLNFFNILAIHNYNPMNLTMKKIKFLNSRLEFMPKKSTLYLNILKS